MLRSKLRLLLKPNEFFYLQSSVIELNNVQELKKVFGWKQEPILDDPSICEFNWVEDVNERKIRDAETLGAVARNINPSVCLDIGTSTGHSAALIAVNAPQARVYTINIPPKEIADGSGGILTTITLEREKIGSYYRDKKLENIQQILANTAKWEPNVGIIDLAYVDGCHDTDFVYNDTLKILKHTKPGSFILWHDFNPELIKKYHWIRSVCMGVEKLLANGHVKGRIFHVKDSWVGVYQII